MSIRQRTTKLVAKRHDLNYFKRVSPIRAWQWWLAAAALICAVAWFSGSMFVHGNALLSSGPMSSSHAVIGERCELCHVPVVSETKWTPSLGMRRHVPDSACLRCHVASPHHPAETTQSPTCGSCHIEHVGATHLAAVADSSCTQCHGNLKIQSGLLHVATTVTSFAGNHPDFRVLRDATPMDKSAATALVFNHAEHMKAGLKGTNGPTTLQCSTCHVATLHADGRRGDRMMPVLFEHSCRSCHNLQFDSHLTTEAPHKPPAEIQEFVKQNIADYAQIHSDVVAKEIRDWPHEAPLPGRAGMPPPHNFQEWIADSVARSDRILWSEKCWLCHKSDNAPSGTTPAAIEIALPVYQVVKQPERWFSSAVFSHTSHESIECAECHTKALTSTSEHDVLMPAITTCRRCHDGRSSPQGPALTSGHAESGCVLCHVYHGPQQASMKAAGLKIDQLIKR
jgi:hypothetical protein